MLTVSFPSPVLCYWGPSTLWAVLPAVNITDWRIGSLKEMSLEQDHAVPYVPPPLPAESEVVLSQVMLSPDLTWACMTYFCPMNKTAFLNETIVSVHVVTSLQAIYAMLQSVSLPICQFMYLFHLYLCTVFSQLLKEIVCALDIL